MLNDLKVRFVHARFFLVFNRTDESNGNGQQREKLQK